MHQSQLACISAPKIRLKTFFSGRMKVLTSLLSMPTAFALEMTYKRLLMQSDAAERPIEAPIISLVPTTLEYP